MALIFVMTFWAGVVLLMVNPVVGIGLLIVSFGLAAAIDAQNGRPT